MGSNTSKGPFALNLVPLFFFLGKMVEEIEKVEFHIEARKMSWLKLPRVSVLKL